jgi:hypothetical protein
MSRQGGRRRRNAAIADAPGETVRGRANTQKKGGTPLGRNGGRHGRRRNPAAAMDGMAAGGVGMDADAANLTRRPPSRQDAACGEAAHL